MNNNNCLKKLLTLILFLIILIISQTTFAEEKLTQSVADIIRSGKFVIKYRNKTLMNAPAKHFNRISKKDNISGGDSTLRDYVDGKAYEYYTWVKEGDNELLVMDFYKKGKIYYSTSGLVTNGKAYYWSTKGDISSVDSAFKPTTKDIYQHRKEETGYLYKHRNSKYLNIGKFLLPIMPEFRDVYANYHKELLETYPHMKESNVSNVEAYIKSINNCTVFSKVGEQNIGGEIYQYVEYRTPPEDKDSYAARYYFKDGNLKKYVKLIIYSPKTEYYKQSTWGYSNYDSAIDTGSAWKEACEQEQSENGGELVDIQILSGDFDSSCLQLPSVK